MKDAADIDELTETHRPMNGNFGLGGTGGIPSASTMAGRPIRAATPATISLNIATTAAKSGPNNEKGD